MMNGMNLDAMEKSEQTTEPKQLKIYYAPMEGITGVHFRRVAHKHFPYVDKYYAPFVQPNQKKVFTPKEKRDILPENNDGIPLVPQVLTCAADGFIRAGKALEEYGYKEINLNLGCPSGTVVSKGKGAGMLEDPEKLDRFLDAVFAHDWRADISIKTRLGYDETSDFQELLHVFHKYPISELIIHARYRTDYYKGVPRMAEFEQALREYAGDIQADKMIQGKHETSVHNALSDGCGKTSLCYNGNIYTTEDYDRICQMYCRDYSGADRILLSVMIGRGLLANPALAREIRGGSPLVKEELQAFHDDIFAMYSGMDLGEKNTLFKMKELWNYWGTIFEDADKELKNVRKANRFSEYKPAVVNLFRNRELTDRRAYDI